MKTLMVTVFGGLLIKAGDPAGGRDLIEQARRVGARDARIRKPGRSSWGAS